MSEVTRPAAASSRGGRGSGRGGRAGFGARSGRGKAADDQNGSTESDNDDQLGALRKKHGNKLTILQEMFNGWSDSDLLSALEEADGDEARVAELISEGAIEQWHEVQKEVHRPKKEQSTDASNGRPARGGRGAAEGLRGRGRNTERGGARAPRGRSQNAATNGARFKDNQQLSVPTEESNGWGTTDNTSSAWGATDNATPAWSSQDTSDKPTPTPAAAAPAPPQPTAAPIAPAAPAKQTWASMLRKSTEPPKPAPKPIDAAEPKPAEPIEPLPPAPVELAAPEPEVEAPAPESEPEQAEPETVEVEQQQPEPESEPLVEDVPVSAVIEPEIALPPPKDQLTQSNLEQVLDVSHPVLTETAASTAADSWDPRGASTSVVATPLSVTQGQQPPKPSATPSSGYATSALKATTERTVRTPSFARRVLDQEEAVRMPGNREVDGAAVQFGAFNLGDEADADDDVEEHRGEPAETRAQPPADSPIAHPRTALPPVQPAASVPDAFGAQKPTSALPTPSAPAAAPTGPSATTAPVVPSGPAAHQHAAAPTVPSQNPQQFDRFAPPSAANDPYQKPFGAFGQQTPSTIAATHQQQPHQPPIDPYSHQSQAQVQPNLVATSGPNDYSSYATADPHNRNNYLYSGYYNNNNNFHHQGQQDSLGSQNRGGFGGGFNASQESMGGQYPQSGLPNQSRFGIAASEAHNSGHSTPNPTAQNQAPGQQGQQGQQPPQQGQGSQHQPHAQGGYPGYNHPYMQNQYYATYGFPYGGYGGPYGKGYGHPYGGPGGHFEHSSNPAPGFGQAVAHRNEAGPGSGLDSYGRVGAQGGGSQPGIGGGMGGFGSAHDTFRSGSYQSQGQGFGGSQPAAGAPGNDDLKPFGDSKAAHSPAIAGVRPTSAANNAGQAGLPPPANAGQGQMGGAFGGYPGHLGHLQQSYGMGNNAGNNQHGSTPYGGNGYQGGFSGGAGGYGGYGNQAQGHRAGSGWGSNY
jgi:hypothetical protein